MTLPFVFDSPHTVRVSSLHLHLCLYTTTLLFFLLLFSPSPPLPPPPPPPLASLLLSCYSCRRSPREYSSRFVDGQSVRDSSLLRRLARRRVLYTCLFRGKLCSWRIVVLLVDVVARVPRMNAQHERTCEIFNNDQRADENKKKRLSSTRSVYYIIHIYIHTHRDGKRTRRDIQIVIQRIERERRRPKDRKPSVCFS